MEIGRWTHTLERTVCQKQFDTHAAISQTTAISSKSLSLHRHGLQSYLTPVRTLSSPQELQLRDWLVGVVGLAVGEQPVDEDTDKGEDED